MCALSLILWGDIACLASYLLIRTHKCSRNSIKSCNFQNYTNTICMFYVVPASYQKQIMHVMHTNRQKFSNVEILYTNERNLVVNIRECTKDYLNLWFTIWWPFPWISISSYRWKEIKSMHAHKDTLAWKFISLFFM